MPMSRPRQMRRKGEGKSLIAVSSDRGLTVSIKNNRLNDRKANRDYFINSMYQLEFI